MPSRPIRVLELRSVRGIGGGPEKTILAGAAQADARRFAVTVCYLRDRRDRVFALDRLASEAAVDYVEVVERHSFDPAIWPALRRLVRDRQVDIVHAHEYKTNLVALMLARAEGVIPLSTVHGWSGSGLRERLLYYPGDRWLLRRFPRVIAVSGAITDRLVRAGVRGDRISTVLNGIDTRRFERRHDRDRDARAALDLPPWALAIGSVGRIESEKRFDVLLEAIALLRQTRPSVTLVLAGRGSMEPPLRARAQKLGVADACLFAGHQDNVMDVYHALDVFVQSSDTEGTPNAILEAMALETPIVATAVGGTPDLITDGVHGLLVPRRDPAALASAIARTLDDSHATRSRLVAARHRVEHELSFAARMRSVEGIYEDLFDRRQPAAHSTAVA